MSKLILAVALIFALAVPASAVEFTAPQVPEKGAELMPEDTGSFAAGLTELLRDAIWHSWGRKHLQLAGIGFVDAWSGSEASAIC